MLRKMKIVFIFAVAFKMFSTYAMEQKQQSCLDKKSRYTLSEKDISSKKNFKIPGSDEEITDFLKLMQDFLKLMQEEKFSYNKVKLVLRRENLNLLMNVPEAMLKTVTDLNFRINELGGSNGLSVLPEAIKSLPHLRKLNLQNNKLSGEEALENLSSLLNLEELDLSENDLKVLPGVIRSLTNLKKLNLSLNSFPGEERLENLSNLTNLEKFNFTVGRMSEEKMNTLRNALPNTIIKF